MKDVPLHKDAEPEVIMEVVGIQELPTPLNRNWNSHIYARFTKIKMS